MSSIHIVTRPHILLADMATLIARDFGVEPAAEEPIELQRDANLRFQGKVTGSGPVVGEIIFEGTEGRPPGVSTPAALLAEFLPIDLRTCGIHGLTGGAAFTAANRLVIASSPATFLVNILVPFRFMRCTYEPGSDGGGVSLTVIAGARP